jgi:murein L,D-transpeptidase YafK
MIFSRKKKKSIIFNNINIIPYPNHKDIYQITFYERYKSSGYKYNGNKELLIKVSGDDIKIFSER